MDTSKIKCGRVYSVFNGLREAIAVRIMEISLYIWSVFNWVRFCIQPMLISWNNRLTRAGGEKKCVWVGVGGEGEGAFAVLQTILSYEESQ